MASTAQLANLLILSDLHLGEDIRPGSKMGYLRHVVRLERELETFLCHYSSTRLDDRPWRLIVNGDMVDFLGVCLLPHAGESLGGLGAEVTPEERIYGLGSRPAAACLKMRRVLERHPGVFCALARFLAAGNEVHIILGNHDVEFHWPAVQETLREGVASLWAALAATAPGALAPEGIRRAIHFHPWFYFQEGLVWIEHGHQYDEYCSFDYVLNPVAAKKEEIEMNVGAAGMRYVSNLFVEGLSSQLENWSAGHYVRWSFAKGLRGAARIGRAYVSMAVRMLSLWRLFARHEAVEERRTTHRARLRALADKWRLTEETLVALDNLRRAPVAMNLAKLLMALMLDRVLLMLGAAVVSLSLLLSLPWTWALGSLVATTAATLLGNRILDRTRSAVDPIGRLGGVPEKIRRIVRTPFVVFGHSHHPVAARLDGGGWYFNTGAWVSADNPGLLVAFTHLLIRQGDDGPEASLCQWRDGRSQVFQAEVV